MIQINNRQATLVKYISKMGCFSPQLTRYAAMKRIVLQAWKLIETRSWIWKVPVAGLCGSLTHTLLMLTKTKLGILESFQPYQSLQTTLNYWSGEYVHPLLPWLISYLNGSTVAGFAFASFYRHLPGTSDPIKGFVAGVLGWLVMDVIFFPVLDLGPFATRLGLGPWPALFSLAMMLAYSVVMGAVYGIVYSDTNVRPSGAERPIRRRPSFRF
ncbi:DUF6789 family protein [Bradyrhizobium cenepequi]